MTSGTPGGQTSESALAQYKAFLLGLPTEHEFREHIIAAYVAFEQRGAGDTSDVDLLVEAARSPELLQRTIDALDSVITEININLQVNERLPKAQRRGEEWERRARRRQNLLGLERNSLRRLLHEQEIAAGRRSAPNPTRRAQERLWQLALAGPVPAGTATRLLAEEQEKVAARKKAARAAAKAASRLARGADRPRTSTRRG